MRALTFDQKVKRLAEDEKAAEKDRKEMIHLLIEECQERIQLIEDWRVRVKGDP